MLSCSCQIQLVQLSEFCGRAACFVFFEAHVSQKFKNPIEAFFLFCSQSIFTLIFTIVILIIFVLKFDNIDLNIITYSILFSIYT
jgi:hypothetical protein